jgi:oligopeptide transport system substrate-binding protein
MRTKLIYLMVFFTAIHFGCQKTFFKKDVEQRHALRLNIHDEPQTLDPRKARHANSLALISMLFDGLTRANKEGKIELSLAERVEISDDLKTYTFHLKNTQWTNGNFVKASDFAYAWKKMLSPNFPSDMVFLLYVIKNAKAAKEGTVSVDEVGIHAPNDQTLVVELEHPTPYFLELVSSPTFFPVLQGIDEQNALWTQDAASYVSNGPFQLVVWKHHDQLVLMKNETYWDAPQVNIAALQLYMLNEETELKMFEKKQLDWAGSPLSTLPIDAIKGLKEKNLLQTRKGLATYFIRTNTEFAPLSHPSIRKAFALAVNRQAIVEHIAQGSQLPATGLVPLSFGLQKQPYFHDGDLQTARQLFEQGLASLGLSKEQLPEISYLYRMTERNHLIAQAIQQQWYNAFGIRIRLEGMEAKTFFHRVSKQDYHFAYGDWIADFADPVNFLEVFKYKGGSNGTLWENQHYAELLDRSYQTKDPKERFALFAQCEQILIEEMPIIPVLYSNMLYLNQPELKDVVLSSMGGIDFKWASFGMPGPKNIAKRD